MNYCKNCGTELAEGTKFCMKCGTPVDGEKKQGGTNYWGVVFGIILLVSGLLTLSSTGIDFSSIGHAAGIAVATTIKVAVPVCIVAFIIKLITKKKK